LQLNFYFVDIEFVFVSLAWANDERVGSLKIAIQLAKLMGDTTMPLFYPSTFVIVTDVLDKVRQ
jgi:hypothetical protein